MGPKDVLQVARMMYNNIANTGDPFVECYYHFALGAKRAAAAATLARRRQMALHAAQMYAAQGGVGAGTAADDVLPDATTGNYLDAVAVLTNIGQSAVLRATGGAKKVCASYRMCRVDLTSCACVCVCVCERQREENNCYRILFSSPSVLRFVCVIQLLRVTIGGLVGM